MNVVKLLSRSYQNYSEQEGSAHSTDNRYTALDEGHIPSSRIDPLTSTTANSLGDRPNLRREAQRGIPISDLTHHDRQLEVIGLETTHDGDIGGRGVMFDIRTKTEAKVRITSLTFHSHTIDMCKVKVFTKRGTHRSFEENSAAWTKIVDTTMECKGRVIATTITSSMFDSSLSDELIIEADIGRAIYIDTNDAVRYSMTYDEDEVFAEDSNVRIFEGTGLSQKYADLHSPRMWNGLLSYEVVGCEGMLTTPSNDSKQTYGHMFNIRSNYAGGIIIHGIEFQTHKTTKLNYEIRTIATNYLNNIGNSEWTLVAEGSVIGAGEGAATAIVGNNFTPVSIEEKTTRGFYITLDTEDLRYAESSGKVGEIFVQNNHISMEVGVGVADYPMGESFFLNRQWSGRVLYRTIHECPSPISVEYLHDVQYSRDLRGNSLLEVVSESVNRFVENFLRTSSEVKSLEEESGNPISLLSTETETTNGGSSSSCANTNNSDLCNTLVSTVTVTARNLSPSNTGYIKFLLLQQNQAVSNAIGSQSITSTEIQLTAKYIGDEPIDTEIQLVLQGIKLFTAVSEESTLLEEVISSFLDKNLSDVNILTVKIINVSTSSARLLIDKELFRDPDVPRRNLDDESLDVTADIRISGIYRPPPDIDFHYIVGDILNSKTDEFRHYVADHNVFFKDLDVIAYLPPDPASPLFDPSQAPISGGSDGGGKSNSLLIVIIVSVVVLGLIAGSYVIFRAVRNKRKGEKKPVEEEAVLFEEELLDDWSQNSEGNVYKKITADTERSGGTERTASSTGSALRGSELECLASGMHDKQHHAIEKYIDHTLPSYTDTDNNSMISGRSGRTGRTGKSRAYSPSDTSRTSYRRTNSPSGQSRASYRRANSPSGQSRASSRRKRSPSNRNKVSSRRTHSPSNGSRATRRTHSPSNGSRASSKRPSSRRTRSPSGRVSSRRTHSPAGDRSVRSTSRTAEYGGGGSVYSKSSKGRSRSKKSTGSGFAAVHGRAPPARRKKINGRSFSLENEDEERAGLVRMTTGRSSKRLQSIPSQKYLVDNRASRERRSDAPRTRDRVAKSPSDDVSMASASTNSSISTKGSKIPGKSYY